MTTTIIDLSGLNPDLDPQDLNIYLTRATRYVQRTTPQVGDFVRMLDGSLRRFTYDWDDAGLQTTYCVGENKPLNHADVGSFYLTLHGHGSYSGSLDDAIPRSKLQDSGETANGRFWFFKNDHWAAHNGVTVVIPCKVWIQQP